MENLEISCSCPICFLLMTEPVKLGCSHIFCKKCIEYMASIQFTKKECPMCRAQINSLYDIDIEFQKFVQKSFPLDF